MRLPYHRIHGVSNLNAWRDGRRVLKTIVTERFATMNTAAPLFIADSNQPL